MNWFEFVFLWWLVAALAALGVTTFLVTSVNEACLKWFWVIFIASIVILGANVIVSSVFLIIVKCRESNFVPTDERDNLIYPPTDIKLNTSLRSSYLREGNVLTAKLADGEVHIYLVHKNENYEFSICCEDGEREQLKKHLSECAELELTFEGKPVGKAEITEVIR